MLSINRRTCLGTSLALLGGSLIVTQNVLAVDAVVIAPPGIKTFTTMPRSATEVASAHLRAKDQGIEFLPKGESLELSSFMPYLTLRDKREFAKAVKVPNLSTRRYVLSVGIEVGENDKAALPALSKTSILDYLDKHYVSVQARIQKDAKGNQYLHQRPVVATAPFGKVRLTEDFQPAVQASVKEIHSLGLYLPAKKPPLAENLRTVVMIHRHNGLDAGGKPEPHHEFIFIRGRSTTLGGKLELHSFITSDERTKLHYLKPSVAPVRYAECRLKGKVYFNRYTGGDLIPADSVVRSQTITSQGTFVLSDLDAYVRTNLKLSGDALSNLNETLDSIIEGRVRALAKTAVNPAVRPSTPASGVVNKPAKLK